MNIRKRGTQMI